MGVATGCGCKEVFVLFYSSIPTFCSFLKMFFFLVPVLFCNSFSVLKKKFPQYKHTYRQHTVLYMKKHTQTYASYPAMDISCISVV